MVESRTGLLLLSRTTLHNNKTLDSSFCHKSIRASIFDRFLAPAVAYILCKKREMDFLKILMLLITISK